MTKTRLTLITLLISISTHHASYHRFLSEDEVPFIDFPCPEDAPQPVSIAAPIPQPPKVDSKPSLFETDTPQLPEFADPDELDPTEQEPSIPSQAFSSPMALTKRLFSKNPHDLLPSLKNDTLSSRRELTYPNCYIYVHGIRMALGEVTRSRNNLAPQPTQNEAHLEKSEKREPYPPSE